MHGIMLSFLMSFFIFTCFSLPQAQGAEIPLPPNISVEAEGKVLAVPDQATFNLEVETQAATAAAAAQANAQQTELVLTALKPALGPQDKVRTLGYRLMPVYSEKKVSPQEIKAYRAINRLELKVMEMARLGGVIDTALQNGASRINGPFWNHSRLEELQRQAAVDALGKARQMAEALAQAAGLKIKSVDKISTGVRLIAPRRAEAGYLAVQAAPPTPIEIGEEEIQAHVQAVYQLTP